MSPILKPYDIKTGFWGQPTATLDWCERNYEVKFSKKILYELILYVFTEIMV